MSKAPDLLKFRSAQTLLLYTMLPRGAKSGQTGGISAENEKGRSPSRPCGPCSAVFSRPRPFSSSETDFLASRAVILLSGRPSWRPGRFFSFPGAHLSIRAAILASRPVILLPEAPSLFWSAYPSSKRLILASRTVILARPGPQRGNAASHKLEMVLDLLKHAQDGLLCVVCLTEHQEGCEGLLVDVPRLEDRHHLSRESLYITRPSLSQVDRSEIE